MMERKFTDDEIVKAVECLHGRILRSRFSEEVTEAEIMGIVNALDLINRQKAEIERLNSCVKTEEEVRTIAESVIKSKIAFIKSEAIKEFAERLKGTSTCNKITGYGEVVYVCDIERAVKEMTGDDSNE